MTKSTSYYVVMQRFSTGLEANVHPEETRDDIIAMLKSGEFSNVVFIHHIMDGAFIRDVTDELTTEADALRAA
jgi:hypothetical protein